MTDDELGAELYPDDPQAGAAHARMMSEKDPAKREAMVRLVETARALQLWEAGLGSKPSGVIVCGPKQIKLARERSEDSRRDRLDDPLREEPPPSSNTGGTQP